MVAKYEHARRSFLALYIVWSKKESQAHKYCHEHGLIEKMEPATKKKLGWQPSGWTRTRERDGDTEKAWESIFEQLKEILSPVEKLVSECEETWDKSAKSAEASPLNMVPGGRC